MAAGHGPAIAGMTPKMSRPRLLSSASSLHALLGLVVRIDHVAGLVFGRPQDHLIAGVAELIEIISRDVLKLAEELARPRPLAILAEPDVAGHRLEGVGVDVIGQLAVIETLGALDGLRQNLAGAVTKRDVTITEGIDLELGRFGLILGEQLFEAR